MPLYSLEIKNTVKTLRLHGLSLNQINQTTNIPKSTIRGWIIDITLTSLQKDALKQKTAKALLKGRIKAKIRQTNNRIT